jgi:hypothetical protein
MFLRRLGDAPRSHIHDRRTAGCLARFSRPALRSRPCLTLRPGEKADLHRLGFDGRQSRGFVCSQRPGGCCARTLVGPPLRPGGRRPLRRHASPPQGSLTASEPEGPRRKCWGLFMRGRRDRCCTICALYRRGRQSRIQILLEPSIFRMSPATRVSSGLRC